MSLQHERPKKKRRPTAAVTAGAEFPTGRRVQIEATRLSLADGVAWIYIVEDVASRVCLAVNVGRRLSKERAAQTLQVGHNVLQHWGMTVSLVIQSDGGSEFTSSSSNGLVRPWGSGCGVGSIKKEGWAFSNASTERSSTNSSAGMR